MNLHYYPETDSLYVEFRAKPGAETIEVTEGLNVDIDADGKWSASTSTKHPAAWTCTRWKPRRCPFTVSGQSDSNRGHYGFADEELDFIINYDIKYRMGWKG